MNQHPGQEQENTDFEAQAKEAQAGARRLKRRILIVFVCMLVFMAVAIPLLSFIDSKESQQTPEGAETHKSPSISFCTPDYDYDIMKDSEYLGLNRYFFYEDQTSGVTVMLDDTNRNAYGPAVVTLTKMVEAIIAGDSEAYNQLFSEDYFSVYEPEEPFTMQQVYDIKISKRGVSQVTPESGKAYTRYEFIVEYKIHKNNGTFRTDIGHDESRKQIFILSERESGTTRIDDIGYFLNG